MTIVLTTHYLDEADSMAERVVVVDHGEVIADDTADGLKAKLAGDRIALNVAPSNVGRLQELAEKVPGVREVVAAGDEVSVRVADGPAVLPELVAAAQRSDVPIAAAQVYRPTLDDVFLNLTGRSLREGTNGKAA
jgi:ABC-2 type transport system ATP-binding protein